MALKKFKETYKPEYTNGLETATLDMGHSHVKSTDGTVIDAFPHAIVAISQREYEAASDNTKSKAGSYIRLIEKISRSKTEDHFFAVGQVAVDHVNYTEPTRGRARWKRTYNGVLMLHALHNLYGDKIPEYFNVLVATSPGDTKSQQDKNSLLYSIGGEWHVEFGGKLQECMIPFASTYYEPWGGYMNVALNDNGSMNVESVFAQNLPGVVIDLGGGTFDIIGINEDGSVNMSTHDSERIGVLQVSQRMKRAIDADPRFESYLADSEDGMPMFRVFDAMEHPEHLLQLPGISNFIDVSDIFRAASSPLFDSMDAAFRRITRGGARYNVALITGGGGSRLRSEISKTILKSFYSENPKNSAVFLSHEDPGMMIHANSLGGDKSVKAKRNQHLMQVLDTARQKRRTI